MDSYPDGEEGLVVALQVERDVIDPGGAEDNLDHMQEIPIADSAKFGRAAEELVLLADVSAE